MAARPNGANLRGYVVPFAFSLCVCTMIYTTNFLEAMPIEESSACAGGE
jgi:hypothetical protein